MRTFAQIIGWGKYLPPKLLTNKDLEQMVDTTDEWIRTRSGIVQRHIAGPKETTATMATRAAQAAIEVADISPSKIDLILVATVTPDTQYPATACRVQDALGASHAGAIDISTGCPGWLYGLSLANGVICSGMCRTVLVIGAETMSRAIDWTDRSTCVLFGDGAGAVILQATEEPTGLLSFVLGSDGSGGDLLQQPAGGSKMPASIETVQNRLHTVHMNGNEVYKFAVGIMGKAALQAIKAANLTVDQIDLFLPHQANIRIIDYAAKQLKLPPEKVFINVDHVGNTSSASIAIALAEAVEQGRVKPGDYIAMVSFGAGLSWAAVTMKWGVSPVAARMPFWKTALHNLRGREAAVRSVARRTARRIGSIRRMNGQSNGA